MWRQHCKKGLNPPRIKPKACHCLLSVFKSRFLDYRVLSPYFRSGTQTVCTVHAMYRLWTILVGRVCMCHDAFAKFFCELTYEFLIRRETCLHDSLDHRKKVDKGDKDLNTVCSCEKCERKT